MASIDQKPAGGDPPRSLSEQLRILEQQLNRLSDSRPVRLVHPTKAPLAMPTSLGRPIGLAPPVRALTLGVPERDEEDQLRSGQAASPRRPFRRRAVVAAISLLLLSSTAVVPSLWHLALPEAHNEPATAAGSGRTEQFAYAARELADTLVFAPLNTRDLPTAPTPITVPPAALPAPDAAAATSPVVQESRRPAGASPATRLTVVESDLQRLSLPLLVSGGGPAWAGSAVIIDGLPADARVSHGMKIAPDTWTVGIDDVGHAVLSLPATTPDRIELSVRVVGANSLELASSLLQIRVLRTSSVPVQIAPAAIFEPAAAETGASPEIDPGHGARQAVKVDPTKRPAPPPLPAKQPPRQTVKQTEWPTATSARVAEQPPAPVFGFAPAPEWSPFGDR